MYVIATWMSYLIRGLLDCKVYYYLENIINVYI